jgi:hypothetical protein
MTTRINIYGTSLNYSKLLEQVRLKQEQHNARATALASRSGFHRVFTAIMGRSRRFGAARVVSALPRRLSSIDAERLCRAFPCRAESPGEGQCPAVSSGDGSALRGASAVPRAIGRASALLSSRGGVMPRRPVQFFDPNEFSAGTSSFLVMLARGARGVSPPV